VKCPNCSAELLSSSYQSNSCLNCNYQFPSEIKEKFLFYDELKNKINTLSNIQQNFASGLENIQKQIFQFEQIISNDLEKMAPGHILKPETVDLTKETPEEKTGIDSDFTPEKVPVKKPIKIPINWEMLFGFNGFLILGVISVIVGVAFFIRKAFVSGYLGPIGKVSVIYLGAVASLAVGNFFRKKKYPDFGLALVGMGIALLYYSTYAGFSTYDIFDQYFAFFLMILITIFASFLAIIDNNKWLAVLGLIGGFTTPVLLSTGNPQNLTLYIYITILNAGLLAIAFYKRWNLLNNLGFIFTYLLFGFAHKYQEYWLSTIFLNLYFFIYSLVPFAYHIFRKEKEKVGNTWLIFINSFVALGFNYEIMDQNGYSIEMLSIITLLYALNFTLMATYMVQKGKQKDDSFIFVISNAALFLVITIPIIFSKEFITIFWVVEAVILLWISIRLNGRKLIYGSYLVMVMALFKFFFYDYDDVFGLVGGKYFSPAYTNLLFGRFVTTTVLIGGFYMFYTLLKKVPDDFNPVHKTYFKIFSIGWILTLFLVLNVETSAFFYENFPDGRFVAVSILWALFAISLMFLGLRANNAVIRKISIGLFFATLAKVFFIDIAKMGTSYKFVSFIVLGLVLILTSYLYRKYKDELIGTLAENKGAEKNEET
jgi:uncharacterized membrane protein